ncbi:cytochrome P450 [Kockovaella imperatae]|uniref:Cytochrome P450 n=1 Tax=Kockovaella imperatae TaxID=4999 RepID=A0A1Y1UGH9_9TREE|nr:cytochrome P450 [Kockovaella imperatae]ORX37132.1 cytochrome P450 [Kockovaella imperatae]
MSLYPALSSMASQLTWTVILILASYLLVRRLSQSRVKYRDGLPIPPLVGNWIPFLGNAIDIARGDNFWRERMSAYGPVFRVNAMGSEKIYTVDPSIISWVYRNSKTCDFPWYRRHMSNHVYGMSRDVAFSPVWDEHLFAMHHRAMSPGMIGTLSERYVDELEVLMSAWTKDVEALGNGQGTLVDLADSVFDIMYIASSKAFFSSSFPAKESIPAFKAFDQSIPLLLLETLPSLLMSPARRTRTDLNKIIMDWWKTIREDLKAREALAPSLIGMLDTGEEEGWSDDDLVSCALPELWALEANAPYAAVWTIVEIVRRPALYDLLYEEITQAIHSLSPSHLSTLIHSTQPELLAKCPGLNAAFQETLRLHTSSFSIRKVMEPLVIPGNLITSGPGKGVGYSVAKDDDIVCVTRHGHVSTDMEWGVTADIWDHTRHLNANAKTAQMWPFGGGTSMCEGRHFASIEILTFLISFIHTFDVQVVSDNMQVDMTRVGLGIIQPKGKTIVRLSRR